MLTGHNSSKKRLIAAFLLIAVATLSSAWAQAAPRAFLCPSADTSCGCGPDYPDAYTVITALGPFAFPSPASPCAGSVSGAWQLCLRTDGTASVAAVSECAEGLVDGEGDELCAWQIDLEAEAGIEITEFTVNPGLTGEAGGNLTSPQSLSVNWIDTKNPTASGGERIPVGLISLTSTCTALSEPELIVAASSQAVDADFDPNNLAIHSGTIAVPESSSGWLLFAGLLTLMRLAGLRRARDAAGLLALCLWFAPPAGAQSIGSAQFLDLESLAHTANEAADRSLAEIGDVNHDGVEDLAIGLPTAHHGRGAVLIVMMRKDGTVLRTYRLDETVVGVSGTMGSLAGFGAAVVGLGDIDGVPGTASAVVAIASPGDQRVWLVALVPEEVGGGVTLQSHTHFNLSGEQVRALANIGDLDGNGVPDLALGEPDSPAGCPTPCGAVRVLLLASDGSLTGQFLLESGVGGMPPLVSAERFGSSLAGLGDIDGDHVIDLAVGTPGYAGGAGGFYLLGVNPDGTVAAATRYDEAAIGSPAWGLTPGLGQSLAAIPGGRGSATAVGLVVGAPKATAPSGNAEAGGMAVLTDSGGTPLSFLFSVDQMTPGFESAFGRETMVGQAIALVNVTGDGPHEVFVDAAKEASGAISGIYQILLSDVDDDETPDVADNCPALRNLDQADDDGDGVGNLCDSCPDVPNPLQLDIEPDGVGDACQPVNVFLSATGTAAQPEWNLEIDCGAYAVSSMALSFLPPRSVDPTGWLASTIFGGGCGPRPQAPGGGQSGGCTTNPELGLTVEPTLSGAFLTNAAGSRPSGSAPLRPNTLYVQLVGLDSGNGPRLCEESDGPIFLGTIASGPADPAESTLPHLSLSADEALGSGAVQGIGPRSASGVPTSVLHFRAITSTSPGANR